MNIVGVHVEPGGVGWHRQWCWTTALARKGHNVKHRPHQSEQWDWKHIDDYLRGADIVLCGRTHNAQMFAALMAGRDLYKYKLVVDTDDNHEDIPRYNQAFADYHAGSGVTRIIKAEFREADHVTVSTEPLRHIIEKTTPKVSVVQNVIDPRMYANVRERTKEPRHADDIRIYWGGGGGHYDDLLMVRDPLLRLFHENPRIKLVFSNFIPAWAADLPPFRVFMVPFAHFGAYPKVLKWICADVAIAPLVDNPFNRCKSNVKYLNYAMAGIPGVYSDLDPYGKIEDGETGMKVGPDGWYDAIKALIDDRALRRKIVVNAVSDVMDNYTVDGHIDRYEGLLSEIAARPRNTEIIALTEGVPVEAPCLTL